MNEKVIKKKKIHTKKFVRSDEKKKLNIRACKDEKILRVCQIRWASVFSMHFQNPS